MAELLSRVASRYPTRVAIRITNANSNKKYTYADLLSSSSLVSSLLKANLSLRSSHLNLGNNDSYDGAHDYDSEPMKKRTKKISSCDSKEPSLSPKETTVALMAPSGAEYVVGTWATWMAKCVAVPLALSHPPKEIEYVLDDANVSIILATSEYSEMLKPLAKARNLDIVLLDLSKEEEQQQQQQEENNDAQTTQQQQRQQQQENDSGALIIYTSGTTGRPKGALHTHGSLIAQVKCLTQAWKWSKDDGIVHCLPLHHIHGIVNALYCAHYMGACVEFMPRFSPSLIWSRLQRTDPPITVFMGVPTMYHRLIQAYDAMEDSEQQKASEATKRLRLTISGSAACPVPIVERWKEISGSTLLERYGMTEIGMALSNPYEGERRAGHVGQPLPGVEVKVVPVEANGAEDDDEDDAAPTGRKAAANESGAGELRVKGPNLFREYWGRPEATADSFDEDGYFKTGDTVVLDKNYYKILGRTSVDILKSGGYKLSALEIEDHLLEHPNISEVAVVGLDDVAYGQIVACVISPGPLTEQELAAWCKGKIAPYKVPRRVKVVDKIERNAMGKVNKKELVKRYEQL